MKTPAFALALILAVAIPFQADAQAESEELAALFRKSGVSGTFAMFDPAAEALTTHDPDRAAKRFIPASTFKIPNTLIGLETGAVASVEEILPYGGKPQLFPQWERDQSLRDAIRVSAVPIYQELARRIGLDRMREWVRRLDYGNATIGDSVDTFWLVGPLEISAVEQTRFLARLVGRKLPCSEKNITAVESITLLDSGEGWELHGKTGWCDSTSPGIGWFVGWVKFADQRFVTFALNIDMPSDADAAKRIPLARACLEACGILPKPSTAPE